MYKNVYEIFDEFEKAKTKKDKIDVLRKNANYALRNVLQGTFNPNIQFIFDKIPTYKVSDAPVGLGYSTIHQELGRVYLFEKNSPKVSPQLTSKRKEEILIQVLESLEAREAEVYANMIMKKQKVKGLDKKIVKEAFPELDFG
jgi:hypothetical protein